MAVDALLLLGANLGDRLGTLRRAVRALGRLDGCRLVKASRVYDTSPIGPSRRRYANLAVRLRTTRTPMGLLIEAKTLEAAAGRRPGKRWSARLLDVDLVAYGDARVRTPWLRVPHPEMARRAFALAPLHDVAPGWKADGRRSVEALWAAMKPPPGSVKIFAPHG